MLPLMVEMFGVLALSLMVLFYVLEERASVYILFFAGACVASALYGLLIGSWPFAVAEAVWALFALRRYWRVQPPGDPDGTSTP